VRQLHTIAGMTSTAAAQLHCSVSIVLHNSCLHLLRRCLDSLMTAIECARVRGLLGEAAVYLVDNDSEQDYLAQLGEMLSAYPPAVASCISLIKMPGNRGFGHGHNVVAERMAADFHLVLNPDAELEPAALQRGLERMLADASIVLVSPHVTGANGAQEFLCKRYPSVLVLLLRGFAPKPVRSRFQDRLDAYEMRDLCVRSEPVDVAIASGCCMLVRADALRAVHGFDERYFLYFEDFDLSLRLADVGRLVFDPAMRIVHHGGHAARKGWRHLRLFVTSGIRFFNGHGWRWL